MGVGDAACQQHSTILCSTVSRCAVFRQGLCRPPPGTRQLLRYMHIHICGAACGGRRMGAAPEWQAGCGRMTSPQGRLRRRMVERRACPRYSHLMPLGRAESMAWLRLLPLPSRPVGLHEPATRLFTCCSRQQRPLTRKFSTGYSPTLHSYACSCMAYYMRCCTCATGHPYPVKASAHFPLCSCTCIFEQQSIQEFIRGMLDEASLLNLHRVGVS